MAGINTFMWTTFDKWLTADAEALLRLFEVSTEFPRSQINDLFNKQIDRLRHRSPPDLRQELEQAKGFDLVGYVAASLRNAGFQQADIDPLAQDIIVRLLVKPGTLFSGWRGQPFMPRVKVSVRNAVLNLVEKRQRRRKWFRPVSPDQADIAMHSVGDDETIERFRKLVHDELGDLGVAVLDARMDGVDVKSLISSPDLFSPSGYQIKKTVQQIKALAQSFGDEQFQAMVQRAMDAEQETLARRFAARVAV